MVMVFYCFLTVPATLAASTFIGAIVPHWKCLWVRPAPASKVNG
jgi:hypothetical protein